VILRVTQQPGPGSPCHRVCQTQRYVLESRAGLFTTLLIKEIS
jgi:hypothetical protein